jgi:NitT/TauT family transport system substrate-binding protein
LAQTGRLLLVALALAAPAPAARAELQTIKMTVTSRTATTAPYFIAIDKGYFAEQGLALELTDAGGGVAIPAMISGSVDFTMSAAVAISAIMRGAQLRVIYTMADRPPYQLWATQPELKTLADLKGKQVGIISRGDTFEIAMRITLRDAGLPGDFVGFTALGAGTSPRQAAMASGALPAVMLSAGDVTPLKGTPALAKAHMLVDMEQSIRMPYTGVATTGRHLTADPELVKRFLRAMLRGVMYMRAYKDETVAVLMRADPANDRAALAADYDDLMPTLTPDGTAPEDLIRKDLQVRAAIINVPESTIPPPAQFYDYAPLRAVAAELRASGWQPTR